MKLAFGLLLGIATLGAAPLYTAQYLNMNSLGAGCSLASNGNASCYNQLYSASTGLTTTPAQLPGQIGGQNLNGSYINSSGKVVEWNSSGAIVFDGTTGRNLPLPANFQSGGLSVSGIDDAGDIAGTVLTTTGQSLGVIWKTVGSSISMVTVGTNVGTPYISPNGNVAYAGSGLSELYRYNIATGQSTPLYATTSDSLRGIGDSGTIVGYDNTNSSFLSPFEFNGTLRTVLCSSTTNCSGLNFATSPKAPYTGLIPLGINASNSAIFVNAYGDPDTSDAFLYSGGQIVDLNNVLSTDLNALLDHALPGSGDWRIYTATGINDQGQIIARAIGNNGNSETTILLTPNAPPVPEPCTFAFLGTGTSALLILARRRGRHLLSTK